MPVAFRPVLLKDLYKTEKAVFSVEVFPPKSPKGDSALFRTLEKLVPYGPAFISCTYGAGGSTRERTVELCQEIQSRYHVTATAHLSCVGATRTELTSLIERIHDHGIVNIMALRGDPPEGADSFQPIPGGLRYANELVALIREVRPGMGVGVAGYPEKHREAPDLATDLAYLKKKVETGADAVFTQLFYINEHFFRFRELYEQAGITVPLVPGIMPVTEFKRIQRITQLCGAEFPQRLSEQLEAVKDDPKAQFEIGVEYAIRQCNELLQEGVPGIHFYVLNKSEACERILEALQLKSEHPLKDETQNDSEG